MDSLGSEVSSKIRDAIKAKLMELDCTVDDELPDYIMVKIKFFRLKFSKAIFRIWQTIKSSTKDWGHLFRIQVLLDTFVSLYRSWSPTKSQPRK